MADYCLLLLVFIVPAASCALAVGIILVEDQLLLNEPGTKGGSDGG